MSNPNREVATIDPRAKTLRDLISNNLKAMGSVLPTHIKPERMARVSLNAVTTTPKLLECNPNTFISAMLECAVLGLEPGVAGQCWILPYKGKATLIVGYKGLVQLCWRSAQIANLGAEAVYEKDGFEYDKYPPRLVHKPYRGEDRGELVAAYAYATLQNGGQAWCVLEAHEVMAIKKRSPAAQSDNSPWNNPGDEHWMWRKTALRQLCKFLPMSVEVQRVVDNDERADAGLSQNFDVDLDPANEVKTGADELNEAVKGKKEEKLPFDK